MNRLFNQMQTQLVIDGYINEIEVSMSKNIPMDIKREIHKLFIKYCWNSTNLFDCNEHELADVVIHSMKILEQKTKTNDANRNSIIDLKKLQRILKRDGMNGYRFCAFGKGNWVSFLKNDNICTTGASLKSWKMIYRFEFKEIKPGSPIYLPLCNDKL